MAGRFHWLALVVACSSCHETAQRQTVPSAETLATGQRDAVDIAVDSSAVYWGRGSVPDGTVHRLAWGERPVELARGDVLNIAVQGDDLFVGGTELRRVDLHTGQVTVLAAPTNGFLSLAVDAEFVFWAPDGDVGGIFRTRRAGGDPETLALNQPRVVDVEVDTDFAYWACTDGVKRSRRDGGEVQVLAGADSWGGDDRLAPARIALSVTHVYWTVTNAGALERDGRVMRVAKGGGASSVIAIDPELPMGIAVDETHVYWTRAVQNRNTTSTAGPLPGKIVRAPVGGGDVEVVAANQNRPVAIALDDENVYWVNGMDGRVMRMTKP